MSYNPQIGLVSCSGIPIPMKYIKAETYIGTESILDLDSYRDANGNLKRVALAHKLYKVEFNTVPLMTESEWNELSAIWKRAFTDSSERKLVVNAYIPFIGDYVSFEAYMPDTQVTIYGTYGGIVRYNAARIAFIGY